VAAPSQAALVADFLKDVTPVPAEPPMLRRNGKDCVGFRGKGTHGKKTVEREM